MQHIAIMKKSWGLTNKILAGEKTIETRWYKNRYKPWSCIKKGDTIYFKDSGEPVTVKAIVDKVEQYENLTKDKINKLLEKYSSKDLGTDDITKEIKDYVKGKRYTIIIFLKKPTKIEPFSINKSGFGAMASWICVEDVNKIKI